MKRLRPSLERVQKVDGQTFLLEFQLCIVHLLHGVFVEARNTETHDGEIRTVKCLSCLKQSLFPSLKSVDFLVWTWRAWLEGAAVMA